MNIRIHDPNNSKLGQRKVTLQKLSQGVAHAEPRNCPHQVTGIWTTA
jgi:hypothetical protein